MDPTAFDALTRAFSTDASRRRLLRLGSALLPAGLLAALLGEATEAGRQHRRSLRNRRQSGNNKQNRKRKRCAKAGQPTSKRRKRCCRGLDKDAGGRCAHPSPGCPGLQPTPTSATQGLQEAINGAAAGATLTLCAGTWNLYRTVVIAKTLTLVGAGAGQSILDGGKAVGVLQIAPGVTVTLQALTLTKGNAAETTFPASVGGGIYNAGTLTLRDVAVTGNKAATGGGIYNDGSGTLTLAAGSSVTSNTAISGGGISNNNGGRVTLQAGSRVSGNTTSRDAGGGIFNSFNGTVTLEPGSSVTGNTAGSAGGGISNFGGRVTLQAGSRVTGNTATRSGGIINGGGSVTVDSGALVCNNNPPASQCEDVPNCPNPASGTCPP